ncbi:Nus1 protein [Candida orthopsilosis Co 90-125]|uniref:ditrans,polycis-polyprenyl diphosphate synthase [(2E,6E)-farnesyldiphosphate specific] n=1 Tax=Candida orthopsilosis (strain 90-125) TaxID=1136231 RepID=H8X309_CANO9|nr:Nus1 protein [Candida orthopsilosis Co 90-125]CCG25869.1 Nus1 protein [Candida orthopsilosis Co 90-125]
MAVHASTPVSFLNTSSPTFTCVIRISKWEALHKKKNVRFSASDNFPFFTTGRNTYHQRRVIPTIMSALKSPRIVDDVRLNNNGEVKLKDVTNEAKSRQKIAKNDVVKAPPSTIRTVNIFTILVQLVHRFFTVGLVASGASVTSLIMFYINHLILLNLFFTIAIYKNVLFIYRKIYLKFLTLTYYPNKSPQVIRDDVNQLVKIPKSVSCILDLKDDDDENGGKDGLYNQISELAAWSVSAGISRLIIYEYTGSINQSSESLLDLSKVITRNLISYFGSEAIPAFSLKVPHKNLILYSDESVSLSSTEEPREATVDLEIDLLSRVDGKPTIVELTKTMSELAVNKELSVNDITIDLIDEELVELVGPEPDLLISFAPSLNLEDYPPWHIRLTEVYWEPENKDVSYAVFIRALKQFSQCKVNAGK